MALSDDPSPEMQEVPVGTAVIERVAERTDLGPNALANVLVELNAGLIGRHAEFERAYDYVTIDGTRAYRVTDDEWDTLADQFGYSDETKVAARLAHTEHARLLFAKSVESHDQFRPDESGVVIGIDTAEQF